MSAGPENRMSLLVRMRERREQAVRQAFAASQEKYRTAEGEVLRLRDILKRQNSLARKSLLDGPADPAAMGAYRQSIGEIRQALSAGSSRLEATRTELERRRTGLLDALRQRKVAENVRRRLDAKATVEMARKEAKAGEDLYASRSAVNRLGSE
jgi:flagellar export protein FliJ